MLLHKEEPFDAEQEYLRRSKAYPPDTTSLDGGGGDGALGWDRLVEASTKGGRMGAALPGPIKQALQQFIRLSGQMAGEEGAVDGATATLYYLMTTGGESCNYIHW